MTTLPREVLSEHFQNRMAGRKLISAVFLTYRFEPAFFERQILPAILDVPVSHADDVRLVQLEDTLRSLKGEIAVYYDWQGLVSGESGSPKLDVRRIRVRQSTGVFHPKNVLLLLEQNDGDGEDRHERALLVASMSANLTRAGWWENVEACHVEELAESEPSRFRDELSEFLGVVRKKATAGTEHRALDHIRSFLRAIPDASRQRIPADRKTQFFYGQSTFAEFMKRAAGTGLRGANLEILSPYFDKSPTCKPLCDLVKALVPKEVRVMLPRSPSGDALCSQELYESVRDHAGTTWGALPTEIMRRGSDPEAGLRSVHAKVYRLFTQRPKRELCFVGSANLTTPAHQKGGNVESGFLIDWIPAQRPEFWITSETKAPLDFVLGESDETEVPVAGSPLSIRYFWDQKRAEVFWDGPRAPRALTLSARGIEIHEIVVLAPREWTTLPSDVGIRIAGHLAETSIFHATEPEQEPCVVLVQEEAMAHKPSLLLSLSAADILRYWSLLTPEQRAAFIETHASSLLGTSEGADLVTRMQLKLEAQSFFDRFAGYFHAFGSLERGLRSALEEHREREVESRLFGPKYDSLGQLLTMVEADSFKGDSVDRYVVVLCAKQLCKELSAAYPEFWAMHPVHASATTQRIADLDRQYRTALELSGDESMPKFMDWFDRWFMKRAAPIVEQDA